MSKVHPVAVASHFSGRDLLAALAVVVIWGLNFVAMKWALLDFTPFQLGVWRYVFAALPLVLVVRRPQLPWRWIVAYGLCQGVGQFGVLFIALQVGMTAALASVLMQTQVFFTALLGVLLLNEHLSRPLKWGLVWAAMGLGCFAMNYLGGAAAAGTTFLGFVLNLVSAAMWSASNIVARRAQQVAGNYDALGFVVWSGVVPIVPFALLSLCFDPPALRWQWLNAPLASWLAVAYLGWCATITAYALWTGLLKRHPASRVAPFSLGVPVIGLVAGMGMLGEQVTPWQWAGGACIVMALVVVMFGARWQARLASGR
ncbi:EamA family transporter [Acidovorax sp. Be4]|uniref:EamA family transporter n=1 Tax=Acidovorax bellezanensis TaxID=2976702 RepID=A0ABT2PIU4_9BURK|nr:EamA family transporter [Acidovorax sp. Be4]MCT9809192.1 EamA family transporter [Acidovorax sp. Be4]